MQHQLVSDQLTILVNDMGAEICSIKNKNGLEYIWSANKEIWGRHAPVLFPIVGKLKENSFIYKGKKYAMGQHGFARDLAFTVVKKKNNSCTFELVSTEETKKSYPFDFIFRISHRLAGNKLTFNYQVKNPSVETLLFSVGAHPAFNCPLSHGEKLEDYFLEFKDASFIQTTLSDGLRSGHKELQIKDNKLLLSRALFDNDALVFENNQIDQIKLCSSKSSHQVIMDCKGWPYFGIWTKPGTEKFVCLEPWYGIADEIGTSGQLDQKVGIMSLEPHKEFDCSFSIEIV